VVLASISSSVTSFVGDYGVYAVFCLMFVDALFPAASELVMVYAGALAAGTFAGQDVVVLGHDVPSGWQSFVAVVLAGTLGYTLGSIVGWGIGDYGGRPFVERHGRWLHLSHERMDRAERWFGRWGDWAVLIGRVMPLVRSFISIPAGVLQHPFFRYTVLTFIGSTLWCLVFAAIGWAAGASWDTVDSSFRYVELAVVGLVVAGIAYIVFRRRSSRRAV
jgi:membrane protein DedA with SNARE-associated domain